MISAFARSGPGRGLSQGPGRRRSATEDDRTAVTAPRFFGRYEVIDLIAHGGMGALYRARDPLIGRYVAIKLLRSGYESADFRERFAREARSAGSLNHPNIVTIYDVGEHEGMPFIAMEYVRGQTFADLIRQRPPLPLPRKLQLIEEVCAGLAHAHEAGIVHRDIKPANLIVGPEGTVKILDFGIAKFNASGITAPGSIIGTLNYMSPEQLLGQSLDARADVFSLGAVMYELISHEPAFPGRRLQEVTKQILSGSPTPITQYVPGLDPRLVRLLDAVLEKEPRDRVQDVSEVRRTLTAIRTRGADHTAVPRADSTGRATRPPTRGASTTSAHADGETAARRARVADWLAASDRAFAEQDYERALEACKHVLLIDASEERAIAQIARVHAAIDERHADAEVAEVKRRLAAGELTLAQRAADTVAMLRPNHPELGAIRQALTQAEVTRARTVAITMAVTRAQMELGRDQWASAVHEADRAIELDPHHAEALAVRAEARAALEKQEAETRLRAVVDTARQLFERGQHQAAIRQLEALPQSHAPVAQALHELRDRWATLQEQQRLAEERAAQQQRLSALELDARRALGANHFAEVRAALDKMHDVDPQAPVARTIAAQLSDAEAAAERREQIAHAMRELATHIEQDELDAARAVLDRAASLAPDEVTVRAGRQRLEVAVATKAAREAADARRRDGEQRLREAEARLDAHDLTAAGSLLAIASTLIPDDPRLADLSSRLKTEVERREIEARAERLRQEVAALILSASQRVQQAAGSATALAKALQDIKQAQSLDPENAEARALGAIVERTLAEIKESARITSAIENAKRRFANGKHAAAIQLLEDLQPQTHPAVIAALDELRGVLRTIEAQQQAEQERLERQTKIASLLTEAHAALHALKFDEALSVLATAEQVEPGRPEVTALVDQVRQTRVAVEQRAKLDQIVAELDGTLAVGDFAHAQELLTSAGALGVNDPRVEGARRRLEELLADRDAAEARAKQCAELVASAEALFGEGNLDEAKQRLDDAKALDPQHAGMQPLLERVERAIGERTAAEEAERQRRTIEELLDAAEQQLASPGQQSVSTAAQHVSRVLQLAPNHERARAMKPRVDAAVAAEREAARIRAEIRNAQARFVNGKHQAAIQLLESLDPSSHPDVAVVLDELRVALQSVRAREEAERAARQQQAGDQATVIVAERRRPPAPGTTGPVPPPADAVTWLERLTAGEFGPPWALAATVVLVLGILILGLARC